MQKIIAKISLQSIQENAIAFKRLNGNRLCAVVKANAYGHGAEETVNALSGIADCFAVALIDEGVSIRTAACGKDILVFTPPLTEAETLYMLDNRFIGTVSDLFTAKLFVHTCNKYQKNARVHLKINTGMNRYGMNLSTLGKVCKLLFNCPFIEVAGIYTHLYEYTRARAIEQKQLFERAIAICKRLFPNAIAHLGGTYCGLLGKEFAFDMTRIGIGLYGYLPSGVKDVQEVCKIVSLKKAMQVYGVVVANRIYRFGGMGYGKSFQNKEIGSPLSVCRFGYADGVLRQKDNGLEDFENNANNLCMDVCIRKGKEKKGDVVPILLDADKTAERVNSISYEVLCAATRRAEFIYEDE